MYDMVTELFDNKPIYQPPNIIDLLDDLHGIYKSPRLDVYKPTSFVIDNVNDLKNNINTQAFKEEMTKPFIHEDMPLPHQYPIASKFNDSPFPWEKQVMSQGTHFHQQIKSHYKEVRYEHIVKIIYPLEFKVMANATKKGSLLLVDSIDRMQN